MEKHFDHKVEEKQVRALWEYEKIYATDRSHVPTLSVDTPPPTVSGSLHIGHIFSYTQTDILVRYARLNGEAVFYPFGFDDNGLPTERFVEKQRNVTALQVGCSEFITMCLEETQDVEKQFEELWRRVGLSVDWQACYSTIDERTRKISQASFIDLYKKGFIYRKKEPALYCTAFRTSVAQADLEDVEKETLFNDIVFETLAGEKLIIGTTRPELLYSCVALFYNPTDTRYKHLQGGSARVPVFGHEVPILADEKVVVEKGTGLVMCCTFGDKTDIEWFKKYNLPYRQSIDFDGRWMTETGPLAGLKVQDARSAILAILQARNALLGQKKITHSVSIYERSKREIEYLMLDQWFLSILPFKQDLLRAADQIEWYPSFMKARFVDWVQNLQWDWCLSRQRFFGVPFPVWHDHATGKLYMPSEDQLPIDPREKSFPGDIPAGVHLEPDTDVMDTWNTSSLTPYICRAVFEQTASNLFGRADDSFFPMGMRPQAHDIIRTWAFYTILKVWMHEGKMPWKKIVISGHVLSSAKEKISKSRGNNPLDPDVLLSQYSADVIRYWTASGTLGHDVAFSENTLKIGNKLVTKLWNACRFAREHLEGFDAQSCKVPNELGVLNEWILHRLSETFAAYQGYFANNEYSLALNAVEQFFWNDLCDNYLELIKYHFFRPDEFTAEQRDATRWTLYHAMFRIVQLFAPFIPFVTESLYQQLFKKPGLPVSIHQVRFDLLQHGYSFPESIEKAARINRLIGAIRKLKSDRNVSLKTEVASLTLVATPDDQVLLKEHEATIKGISAAVAIAYACESAGISRLDEVDGVWHMTLCVE